MRNDAGLWTYRKPQAGTIDACSSRRSLLDAATMQRRKRRAAKTAAAKSRAQILGGSSTDCQSRQYLTGEANETTDIRQCAGGGACGDRTAGRRRGVGPDEGSDHRAPGHDGAVALCDGARARSRRQPATRSTGACSAAAATSSARWPRATCRSARPAPARSPRRCRQGLHIELFWILDDIAEAEALVARNGRGIESVADLKGKKVGVPFVSTTHFHLHGRAGDAQGRRRRTCSIINMRPPEIAAAWERGDIDATFVWDPVLARDQEQRQGHHHARARSPRQPARRPSTASSSTGLGQAARRLHGQVP